MADFTAEVLRGYFCCLVSDGWNVLTQRLHMLHDAFFYTYVSQLSLLIFFSGVFLARPVHIWTWCEILVSHHIPHPCTSGGLLYIFGQTSYQWLSWSLGSFSYGHSDCLHNIRKCCCAFQTFSRNFVEGCLQLVIPYGSYNHVLLLDNWMFWINTNYGSVQQANC